MITLKALKWIQEIFIKGNQVIQNAFNTNMAELREGISVIIACGGLILGAVSAFRISAILIHLLLYTNPVSLVTLVILTIVISALLLGLPFLGWAIGATAGYFSWHPAQALIHLGFSASLIITAPIIICAGIIADMVLSPFFKPNILHFHSL